jgi:hypothetical protein
MRVNVSEAKPWLNNKPPGILKFDMSSGRQVVNFAPGQRKFARLKFVSYQVYAELQPLASETPVTCARPPRAGTDS